MEEERHDYPRYREIERMSRRLSLPQISRLLKRSETLGDPFSFSSGTPPSRPLNSPPRIRKYAHLTALSLPGRLLTKVFSLITRHREIYVSGGRFFSLDVSCHDFRRGVVEKTARLYDAFGTRLFLEEKLSLLLHPLCPFPEKQVKKVVIGSLPPSFFFPFLSFFIPNSRHKFLDEGTPRGRCHKRFVAKRLFAPLLLHLLN